MGPGTWNNSAVSSYNLKDPILRDTVTVMPDSVLTANLTSGWTAIRFEAHNPGVWVREDRGGCVRCASDARRVRRRWA